VQNRISNHIRANVIAYAALFFALSGTAYALDGPLPGQNQVGSDDIINGEVKTADIGTGEVKNGDIGAFEIKANNIAPDSLGSAKIADRSVKNADLGLGASSSNTIADGGIQGVDVKNNTLTGTQIDELSLDLSLLQKRIADACPTGQAIRAIAQNGTVTCESTGGGGGSSWSLSGNSGTTSSNFLGTTDNQPLNLRVNGARGLRLEPASDGTNQSPNVIGGIADNSVTSGVHSAVIGGGGRADANNAATANKVTDDFGTVGGGAGNRAGDDAGTVDDRVFATIAGGLGNTASGSSASVLGGNSNIASGGAATVTGGGSNIASGQTATVGGGVSNNASGDRATVSGGDTDYATGHAATVPGGAFNTAQGDYSFAGGLGGQANHNGAFVWADSNPFFFSSTAQDQFNVRSTGGARLVSGIDGSGNPTSGLELPAGKSGWSTLVNGQPFDIQSTGGTRLVSGVDGSGNPTSGLELPASGSGWSTLVNGQPFDIRVNGARALRIDPASDGTNQSPNVIGGSADNSVTSGVYGATIAGGNRALPANPATANKVTDHQGTVGGGANNQAGDGAGLLTDATAATVGGGRGNTANGTGATVGGGLGNFATGPDAMVPGGFSNTAQGLSSFAAGRDAKALHDGSFVWADSTTIGGFGVNFASTAANQFSVRATGGARFVSGLDGSGNPNAGVQLAPGGGSWSSLSDRAAKRAIRPASGRKVLRKLASVPVSTWSYRAQDDSIRHIGPMAQDFYRVFGVGEDRRHIDSVDADGVALAAIKGLNRKVERLQRKVASLKRQGAR
jgi:trimeric autotransporter adhesin